MKPIKSTKSVSIRVIERDGFQYCMDWKTLPRRKPSDDKFIMNTVVLVDPKSTFRGFVCSVVTTGMDMVDIEITHKNGSNRLKFTVPISDTAFLDMRKVKRIPQKSKESVKQWRVHFNQVNECTIRVTATTEEKAIEKAMRVWRNDNADTPFNYEQYNVSEIP